MRFATSGHREERLREQLERNMTLLLCPFNDHLFSFHTGHLNSFHRVRRDGDNMTLRHFDVIDSINVRTTVIQINKGYELTSSSAVEQYYCP